MNIFSTHAARLAMVAVAGIGWLSESPAQSVPFQIEFGLEGVTAEQGEMLAESANGDILVAGLADVRPNDVAEFRTRIIRTLPNAQITVPMLARVDRSGHLLWRRTYPELTDFILFGLLSDKSGDFIAVRRFGWDKVRETSTHYSDIELRRIGPDGDLTEVVVGIQLTCTYPGSPDARGISSVRGDTAVLIFSGVTARGLSREAMCEPGRSLIAMASDGSVKSVPAPEDYWPVAAKQSGEPIFLRRQATQGIVSLESGGSRTESVTTGFTIATQDMSGGLHRLIELPPEPDVRMTTFPLERDPQIIVASNAAIFLLRQLRPNEYREWVVSAYSVSGIPGANWVLDDLSGLPYSAATPEGGIVLSGVGRASREPIVQEYSDDGQLRWSAGFLTAGGSGTPLNVLVLSDGWLAITGHSAAGDWHLPPSIVVNETFLLVAERSSEGLRAASYQPGRNWSSLRNPPGESDAFEPIESE